MQVGFIGLGAMGTAMVRNLLAAGHDLRVWNRSPEQARQLAAEGATAVAEAREAVGGDAVITMLANDEAVRAVFLEGGALDAFGRETVHVNCATISVALAQELAEAHAARGLSYVAAPVFGRPEAAAARLLNIMVAGPAAAIAKVQPLFDAMGQKTWPVGDVPHQANVVKIAGNLMIAAAIESMAEVVALGKAHGLDPKAMIDIYTNTMFACRAYQSYAGNIVSGHYEPAGFKLALGLKDVRLALAAGDDVNVPLPLGSVIRDALISGVAAGDAAKDWSALGDVALRRSGLR